MNVPINLIAIYNFNHVKLAYTQTAKNDQDYQLKYQKLMRNSHFSDWRLYVLRRLDTPQAGPGGLKQYDSYYQDFRWCATFAEFQSQVRILNQITDVELKQYWHSKYGYDGSALTDLFNQIVPQLNFKVQITNRPIQLVYDRVAFVNSKSVLVSKLSRLSDGYQQWEIINRFPVL